MRQSHPSHSDVWRSLRPHLYWTHLDHSTALNSHRRSSSVSFCGRGLLDATSLLPKGRSTLWCSHLLSLGSLRSNRPSLLGTIPRKPLIRACTLRIGIFPPTIGYTCDRTYSSLTSSIQGCRACQSMIRLPLIEGFDELQWKIQWANTNGYSVWCTRGSLRGS